MWNRSYGRVAWPMKMMTAKVRSHFFESIDRVYVRELCKRICDHSSIFIDWRSFNFIDRRPCHGVADVQQKHWNKLRNERISENFPARPLYMRCDLRAQHMPLAVPRPCTHDTIFVTDFVRNSNCVWILDASFRLIVWMTLDRMRWVTQLRKYWN